MKRRQIRQQNIMKGLFTLQDIRRTAAAHKLLEHSASHEIQTATLLIMRKKASMFLKQYTRFRGKNWICKHNLNQVTRFQKLLYKLFINEILLCPGCYIHLRSLSVKEFP